MPITEPITPLPEPDPSRLRPTLGLLPVIAISAAVAGPAMAQTTGGTVQLDPIVVDGPKGGEAATDYRTTTSASPKVLTPLAETPKTIKVITRKEIAERGATSVTDILRTTPGITMGTGENGNTTGLQPTIRGASSTNNVTVDGFTSALRTDYEAFNLETVEVNKGADGSTSGTGAAGGSINMGSKAAILGESFNDAALTFGTGALKRATLDMNRSFGDVALRLNVMAQEADSLRGFGGQTSSRRGVAGSLTYNLGDSTTLTAGLYYFKDNDLENYGVPFTSAATPAQFARGTGTATDPFLPVDVPTGTFYGFTNRDFKDATTVSAYGRIEHRFDNGLTWTTALKAENIDRNVALTRPGAATAAGVTTSAVYHEREGKGLSFNSQLKGETTLAGMKHTWAIGVDLSRSEIRGGQAIGYAQPGGFSTTLAILNPDTGVAWPGAYPTVTLTDYEYKTRALYLLDVIDLSPQMQLSVGLRFDDFEAYSRARPTAANPNPVANRNNSRFWNGNIGLTYKLSEQGMVYAAFSTSAEPVGESNGAGAAANSAQDSLDPERSVSIELGTKWTLFDERLLLSAAVYQNRKTNDRVTDITGVTANIGETRNRGFELDIAGQITERWGISAGYAFTDAEIVNAGFSGGVPSASNGTKVGGVPRHALSLWTTYAVNDKLTLGGGAFYTGKRPMGQTGASRTALPSQVRVDLMASYQVSEGTAIQFNANNIFDEQLYVGNRGNGFANMDAGRNFTLALTHSF